eukprot:6485991-Amphidinium_carterae.1
MQHVPNLPPNDMIRHSKLLGLLPCSPVYITMNTMMQSCQCLKMKLQKTLSVPIWSSGAPRNESNGSKVCLGMTILATTLIVIIKSRTHAEACAIKVELKVGSKRNMTVADSTDSRS